MSNASLGLELEYFGFRVFLSAQGNQEEKIEEKDFKCIFRSIPVHFPAVY